MIKTLISVALLGACLLSMGCDEDDWYGYGYGYGCCGDYHDDDWTDVGVGVGFWPAYGGYVVEDYPVTDYYYDGGGYYYDDSYGDYYGDYGDWKTKRAGRSK
jgi:hypothetical protein